MSLEPGVSVEVVATFDEAGEMLIGCHVPGHWEAGMRGTITVLPAASV
ncbi:MAG: plastocyanin/azurin family copper-binding protein [Chloroflexota bacterium]|nr:plastocyanin/azurin family copper-binding protein [Chloroflexota bacterium]